MKKILLIIILIIIVSCQKNEYNNLDNQDKIKSIEKQNFKENNLYEKQINNQEEKQNYPKNCNGKGTINFTSPPRRIEDIELIEPMGLVITSHVTPIDHQYYYPKNWKPDVTKEDLKDVLAPADGIITSIQKMPEYFSVKNKELKDYRLEIRHTCTFYTIYIHIYQLSEKIEQILGEIKPSENKQVNIPVKAGEIIGRANALDFSAHNDEIILTGFINKKSYDGEPWKIHTVDPFDYFIEPVKIELLKKNIRTAKPLGGKIDYDIDGKLIGNWFKENTNGYRGIKQPDYWITHFSIIPDALDPEHIIISLGEFNGKPEQFGIKNNSPNPLSIDKNSGMIKYELVQYNYKDITGKYWDRKSYVNVLKAENYEEVYGVILLKVLENNKLKLEIFPDKKENQINEFTEKAMIYER